MDAKEFVMFVNDLGIVKLAEWGSRISNAICMRRIGAVWIVNMVKKLRVTSKLE